MKANVVTVMTGSNPNEDKTICLTFEKADKNTYNAFATILFPSKRSEPAENTPRDHQTLQVRTARIKIKTSKNSDTTDSTKKQHITYLMSPFPYRIKAEYKENQWSDVMTPVDFSSFDIFGEKEDTKRPPQLDVDKLDGFMQNWLKTILRNSNLKQILENENSNFTLVISPDEGVVFDVF